MPATTPTHQTRRRRRWPSEIEPSTRGRAQSVADLARQDTPAVDPLAALRVMPVPPARGWPVRGGGRDHHVGSATLWQGTTTQLAGLYPFVGGSGSRVRGVPIGHDLHTHEPVGLHPGDWLRDGLA